MKLPVTIQPDRGNPKGRVTLSLRPDILRAFGLSPGKPITAVIDPCVLILCRAEDAEAWEALLSDFPAALIGQADSKPARRKRVLTR